MAVEKRVKEFAEFEKRNKLFERKYNGFPYWQSIRFEVCEKCLSNREDVRENILAKKSKKELFLYGIKLIGYTLKEKIFPQKISESDLLVLRFDKLKDRFFDCWSIPKSIKYTSLRILDHTNEFESEEHLFEIPRLKEYINRVFQSVFKPKNDNNEIAFLKKLEMKLRAEFGKSPSYIEIKKAILYATSQEKIYSKFYKKIIKKTGCKAVLCIVYYNPKLFPLLRIAKDKNIRIIELQHGVVSNHESYYFLDDRGINNYTPDYMLTFGDVHNKWMRLTKNTNAISVGAPYQQKAIEREKDLSTNDKIIMVYPERDTRFEEVIDKLEKIITNEGYRIIIKLHPIEANNYDRYYPLLSKNKNIEVIKSQSEGIYHWLKLGKHHIMARTTVGLEAMAFDHCNVCIAEFEPHAQTQCLLDWGVARGFNTPEELKELILHPIQDNPAFAKVRDQLWKRNAKDNMEAFFKNMAANGWEHL